jgi:hydrogenase maturation factor HypF (carbamoyltransferase family)
MVIYFAKKYKIRKIVLSGGCFQNLLLLEFFYKFLYNHVDVYFHKELSPGDSSVSIGQLLIANALLNQKPQGVKYVFSNSYENIADPLRK